MSYKAINKVEDYTDLELALMVMMNVYGTGTARKKALGSRYQSVQQLVTEIMTTHYIPAGDRIKPELDRVRRVLELFRPTDEDYDAFMKEFLDALKGGDNEQA